MHLQVFSPVSKFAFKCNLFCYIWAKTAKEREEADAVGLCRLNQVDP